MNRRELLSGAALLAGTVQADAFGVGRLGLGEGRGGLLGTAQVSSYTAAATTLFAAMTTPPTTARKTIINNLIVSLQSAGVWNSLDALYLLAAADSQAARLNWVNPATFTAIAVNSPTFVADQGYTGDGATSRLATGYTPSVNGVQYTLNDASLWGWSRTNAVVAASNIGSLNNPASLIVPRNTGDVFTYTVNSSTFVGPANADSSGLSGAQRVSAGTIKAWRNGAQVGANGVSASTALSNQEQWICGADAIQFSTYQMAAAAWGASLTGKESAFYSAMLAYMQAVGAA